MTEHGANPSVVSEVTILEGLPEIEEDAAADEVPQREELMPQLRKVKDSSPGDDQMTTGMLKVGGDVLE